MMINDHILVLTLPASWIPKMPEGVRDGYGTISLKSLFKSCNSIWYWKKKQNIQITQISHQVEVDKETHEAYAVEAFKNL